MEIEDGRRETRGRGRGRVSFKPDRITELKAESKELKNKKVAEL